MTARYTRTVAVASRLIAAFVAIILLGPGLAFAQDSHDAGHHEYRKWHNLNDFPCCDGQDCGQIEDADVQFDGDQVKVRVEGQWCPVQSWMYLKTGNAPDWSHNHVCVVPDTPNQIDHSVCSRLKCFQPKPGT